MAEKIFKRVVADDGTETFVEVTEAAELPEELVKANPLYTNTLNESIKRRKIIQDLKKPVMTNEDDTEIVAETPAPKDPVVTAPAPVDEDALFAKFRQRMLEETTVETKAEKQAREARERAIDEAMNGNGLPSNLRSVVANSNNPAETAKTLAQAGYRFDTVEGGEVPSAKSAVVSDVITRLNKRFQGDGKK